MAQGRSSNSLASLLFGRMFAHRFAAVRGTRGGSEDLATRLLTALWPHMPLVCGAGALRGPGRWMSPLGECEDSTARSGPRPPGGERTAKGVYEARTRYVACFSGRERSSLSAHDVQRLELRIQPQA